MVSCILIYGPHHFVVFFLKHMNGTIISSEGASNRMYLRKAFGTSYEKYISKSPTVSVLLQSYSVKKEDYSTFRTDEPGLSVLQVSVCRYY